MARFLHSSDLHLGRPFARFPEDVRGRLRQARMGCIARLAAIARAGGATHVLLAGDTFDSETPAPATIRQALNAMAADPAIGWIILPGNHDSLAAAALWDRVQADRPANVTLALTPAPIAIPGGVVLPAPCTHRRPGRDLTADLDQPTPEGMPRIGLAHGGVTDFGPATSEDGATAIIPPDRAARSGLAYLALGDWHGRLAVGPATWYSGTPEPDSFKHADRDGGAATANLVADGVVTHIPTADLVWRAPALDLSPGDDVAARLAAHLPPLAQRAATLIAVTARGRLRLPEGEALSRAITAIAPDFLHASLDTDALAPVPEPSDLDLIDHAGALRAAADRLVQDAADPARSEADRALAAAALARLFAYATADAS
jgi:DNA repair exonuclease SbcCD nuclease subunit